ncbi:B3 domain-containing transcription repressor VAL1 [Sesamum alatum]|uniref:B3 domain-containing transcription repressor VAL1 n=1 Tax=Sesamum alatum TaxID=300844 RepID=A0AAE2CF47_9LAMI|nr:B3 domain-containing transcription repressor VAL1 [Sesamum alatum]
MGSKNCMNEACRGTTSSEWKKGWSLKSGGFATLCYSCGSAYENSLFCETFHSEESGWRDCRICGKRIHCGCIASRYLHEYLDLGGVGCINCAKRLEIHSVQSIQIPGDIPNGTFATNGIRDVRPVVENQIDDDKFSTERLLQLTKAIGSNDVSSALEQLKPEESMFKTRQSSKRLLNLAQQCSSSALFKTDNNRPKEGVKDIYESLPQPSLNFSLTTPLGSSSSGLPFPGAIVEGSEQKGSFQQGQRTRHVLPKPPKPSPTAVSETNKGTSSQTRVARPPAEGRGRNQLLPRYWPKITDQELQQLSGDLKSTIVPLFEKILSASDAGRIGRLVLPKACAEAYFPPINQSEGIPIRIQDIKGKEWTFQFRFWPNNNSRMYVLEGVTPCIQNMQVQAGDTVTFSRIDPGGQLVIGCRKATNNIDVQEAQTPSIVNGDSPGETSFSGVTDNPLSNGGRTSDDSLQRHMPISEKKKARNIKNKRLLMPSDDAMELRITWEEAQELLRPSPTAEPNIVMVEDHEFEEFEEPPIFGKRTIFTSRASGEQEQLAQCDSCSKWRRLPVHALLSAKWTCSENIWDSKRSSCAAPEDINPRDLESFISIYKDSKKRKISDNKVPREGEPSGLDALATAAVLGDNISDIAESSVGATTRHPRHRPGCTCIVCIQPPSGKGKHEPMCKCNVCLTVRRRFKTLMMRKKKRQSEREAELAQGKDKASVKIGLEREDIAGHALLNMSHHTDNETNQNGNQTDLEETNKGQLDLNCDPHREDDILAEAAGMSLTTLMNAATLPLDMYLGQNGVPVTGPCLISRESEENAADEGFTSGRVEQENNREGG